MYDAQYKNNRNDQPIKKLRSQPKRSSKQGISSRDSAILKTYNTNISSERLNRTIPRHSSINKLSSASRSKYNRKVISMFDQHQHTSYDLAKSQQRESYTIKSLFGRPVMNSKQETTPSFTFAGKSNDRVVISKQHMGEVIGRDSPGVGAYKYDNLNLTAEVAKHARFAVTKGNRFDEERIRQKLFKDS